MPNPVAIIPKKLPTSTNKPIFPADIWNYIVNRFLPAYSRVGRNSLHNTCKALSKEGFPNIKRPSIKEVIASCITPQDALNILNDPGLCEQLSFSELLKVAGTHPLITEHLLQFSLYPEDLDSLGSNNIASASLILRLKHNLNLKEKGLIVRHHYTLAKKFVSGLSNDELFSILSSLSNTNLKELFRVVVEERRYGLGPLAVLWNQIHYYYDPELGSKLLSDEVSPLNKENCFLHFETLCSRSITVCEPFLCLMSKQGKGHEILDNPELARHLQGKQLAILGRNDPSVAKRIINDVHLKSKLTKRHTDFYSYDLMDEEIDSLLQDLVRSGAKNINIPNLVYPSEKTAKRILNDNRLKYRLNGHTLYRLCHRYPALELQVLRDGNYRNIFDTYFKNFKIDISYAPIKPDCDMFYYRSKHIEADFLYKLPKDGLKIYSARCATVAMAVIKDPKLRDKIFEQTTSLASYIPRIANIPYVCVNQLHLEFIKDQVAKGKNFNETEEKMIKEMDYRVSMYHKIMDVLNKLRQHSIEENELLVVRSKIFKLCELPIDSRFDEFMKLAKAFLTSKMSTIEDAQQIEMDLNQLKVNSADVIKQMLESSNIDSCVDLIKNLKLTRNGRKKLPVLELPWEMKRSAVEEIFSQDTKKPKRG